MSTTVIRRLVSKKKKRFEWGDFDLDLSYITDRIIAMGYPSENFESLYRNKMSDVQHFLDELHTDHYKVYNLCAERKYPHDKFHGRVAEYPFFDHQTPSLELGFRFCFDVVCIAHTHLHQVQHIHEMPTNDRMIIWTNRQTMWWQCTARQGRGGRGRLSAST